MQKRKKVYDHHWWRFCRRCRRRRLVRQPVDDHQQHRRRLVRPLVDDHKQRVLRSWEDLPSPALVIIFCKTDLNDRLRNIPLVCKAWKSALDHPDCWSSMLASSSTVSPEDVFIKKCNLFPNNLKLRRQSFETLIKRSGGGSGITSLYITPRFCRYGKSNINETDVKKVKNDATISQVFGLIANSCPNLKHISFHKFDLWLGIEEGHLEIFRRCKKLELVDFFCSSQLDSPDVIQEMANHLPLLKGIRILGWRNYDVAHCIATYLPRLQLLNLGSPAASKFCSNSSSLSTILSSCFNLQYLNVSPLKRRKGICSGPMSKSIDVLSKELIDQAYSRIPEFSWCNDDQYSIRDFEGWNPWLLEI